MLRDFILPKPLKKISFILLCMFISVCTIAQTDTDSLKVIKNQQAAVFKKKPSKFVLPAAMFGVGALALESRPLMNLNRFVRQKVLETKPNVDNHFEDRLRHLPSATAFFLQAVGIKGKHNFIEKAAVYALATTIADQTASRLKTVSRHQRPDGSDFRSFPSGHTTTAFVAAEFLRKEYGHTSPWLVVGGYTAAAATGALRVYHNKHWLTDVVAGAGVGILSTDLAYFVYSKAKQLKSKAGGKQPLIILPSYQQKIFGLGFIYQLH